jgi:hypothetical protein
MALAPGDTLTWHGGAEDGDIENAANWTPAEAPIDDIHVRTTDNANPWTTNLDQTAYNGGAGMYWRTLVTSDGFSGDIGANGNELKIAVVNTTTSAPSIVHRGSGSLYFSSETGTAAKSTGWILINSPNRVDAAILSTDATSTPTGIACLNGATTITANYSRSIANLVVGQARSAHYHPTVTVAAHATSVIAYLDMNNGDVTMHRTITAGMVAGGLLTLASDGHVAIRLAGGTVHQTTSEAVSNVVLLGGHWDTTTEPGAKTISNLWRFPGGSITFDADLTISNELDVFDADWEGGY